VSEASNTAAQSLAPNTDRADLRPESIQDAVIRLAGNSQDGIQTAGAFLARLAGRSEHDVMTYMTIPATISGGPSIFQVRIGSGEVLSAGDEADFLVAFYQHSYQDHIGFLREGGVVLYDSDNVEPNLDDKRFVYVGVPITGLTVEALGGTAKDKGKNMFVLGLICKIFHLDADKMKNLIGSYPDVGPRLASQRTGSFFLLTGMTKRELKADRSLMETVQSSESEVSELARATRPVDRGQRTQV
jgi:Pyruvate/2-oxoacid:ferredoxin oxidoreductase gamma subunit